MPDTAGEPLQPEAERLAVLRGLHILDTPPEAAFDELAQLAALACEAPAALVSLVDEHRQWFKAGIGLNGLRETPRDQSVCAHTMLGTEPLVVPDLTADPRFAANPLVTSPPGLRFYAGAPLHTANGVALGSLCVLDTVPRSGGLTDRQRAMLRMLARQVVGQLESHRLAVEQAREAQRLAILNRVGTALAGELDLPRLVQAVTDAGRELTGAASAAFVRHVVDDDALRTLLHTLPGAPPDAFADLPVPHGASTVHLDDAAPHGASRGPRTVRSYLAVPLLVARGAARAGGVFGALLYGHPEPGMFSARDAEALRGLAAQAAIAIENARLLADARREAEERRRAEALARAEQARATEILESIGDAFYALDGEFRFTYVNHRAQEIWQLGDISVIGRRFLDVFPQAVLDGEGWRLRRQVAATGRAAHADIVSAISGRWVSLTIYPGAAGGISVYFRDITRRKVAEQALKESETRFRAITETMPQIVWSARPDGRHDYHNQRWHDFTGTVPAHGKDAQNAVRWAALFHPDDRTEAWRRWRRSLRTGEAFEAEYRLRQADGAWRWFLGRALPVRDEADGSILRWFGTCTDIEHAVRARETLRRSAAELDRMVRERTRQLEAAQQAREDAQDQLRHAQKMEAVGQLTGGIAHDFNNLLAGIMGSLELLRTRAAQGRPAAELDRYVAAALGAANRAAALTHRLLAFSRRQTLDPKPIAVDRLVTELEELIRRTVGPAIRVETAHAPDLWTTLCDPHQLENALLNLCINARDAMPNGGTLRIETANAGPDGADIRGQHVALRVADTGTGMAPEVIARAFDPFFTTKPLGQGTGLGLSMVYGFIRQSGGQVRISSQPGRGTAVRLFLPRHHGAPAPAPAPAPAHGGAASHPGAGGTVLVVDDEATVRMLVTEVLGSLGYAAVEAADGPAGLRILQADAPIDLLITDVGLPGGMNGRQLADAARQRRPGLKVMLITGYAETAAVGNGQLAPGMAVMTKPFALDTLADRIRSMIEAPAFSGH